MICRKPKPHKYEIRLQSTYTPQTYSTSINSERFVFIQNKLSTTKGCEFDPELEICECGAGLDEFLTKCPKLNK